MMIIINVSDEAILGNILVSVELKDVRGPSVIIYLTLVN